MEKTVYEEPKFSLVEVASADWILTSSDGEGQGGGVVLPDDEW